MSKEKQFYHNGDAKKMKKEWASEQEKATRQQKVKPKTKIAHGLAKDWRQHVRWLKKEAL